MIRRLLIPLAATALLAGCVTSPPYGYRTDGHGDYYYGSPYVEYRYQDAWPYYGYGSYYYGPYRPGFSVWGGYYGGGYPYYGYPYYGSPYRYTYPRYQPHNGHHGDPRGGNGYGGDPRPDNRPDGGPWRNPDEIVRRRRSTEGTGGGMVQVAPRPSIPEVSRPDPGAFGPRMGGERSGGTAPGDVIRRARRGDQNER